jgi:hypothetical protein
MEAKKKILVTVKTYPASSEKDGQYKNMILLKLR